MTHRKVCSFLVLQGWEKLSALGQWRTERMLRSYELSGQNLFRSMWERYCRGVSAIVFVVDSAIPRPSVNQTTGNEVKREAEKTKEHIERIAPLLGLNKPGPGSPGGSILLHQPIISLSNGQTRRARICGTLVSLARRQEGKFV